MMASDRSSLQEAKQRLAGGQNNWLDKITHFTDNYYDPSNPSSFSTFEKLYRTAKMQPGVEPSTVKHGSNNKTPIPSISRSESDSRETHILLITLWIYGKRMWWMYRP